MLKKLLYAYMKFISHFAVRIHYDNNFEQNMQIYMMFDNNLV